MVAFYNEWLGNLDLEKEFLMRLVPYKTKSALWEGDSFHMSDERGHRV